VGGAFLLLLIITTLSVRARRHRYLIVGWLWFLIMLIPMMGLVQVDVQAMADRYAYVSFIGLFLMICWGVADWAAERRMPKALLPVASVAALLALSVVTYRQIGYWSSNVTLWAHSAEVTSGNWKAEYWLGTALDADGQHQAARRHYLRAAAINPFDPFTNLNIAMYEHQRGNLVVAIEYYKKVLPQAWNSEQRAMALTNMASAYRGLGDTVSADQCMATIKTLPQRTVDWQGAWWKNIIPMIREYFHHASQPEKN
jgi:tetratricopeptide (TPR) repeat protein